MMNDDDDDDDFLIDDDQETSLTTSAQDAWVMLIVDDEVGIHEVTTIALNRFSFEGRKLEFLNAYSGKEAIEILKKRDDVALILLDVVMENDHAGLDCARAIRDDLGVFSTRIVLRTGQPGIAPEEEVILAYDINDYRAKTELTTERLFTTVVSALRSYRDILALNQYREDAYKMLNQNRASIQSLIDLCPTPLIQVGNDQCIHRCNKASSLLLKTNIDTLIGENLSDVGLSSLQSSLLNETQELVKIGNDPRSWQLSFTSHDDGFDILLTESN